ncbi:MULTISPECIES: hypothetical protein [Burkholderia]|nr:MULTISPECIES: hypothetical protein [Burkholderia]
MRRKPGRQVPPRGEQASNRSASARKRAINARIVSRPAPASTSIECLAVHMLLCNVRRRSIRGARRSSNQSDCPNERHRASGNGASQTESAAALPARIRRPEFRVGQRKETLDAPIEASLNKQMFVPRFGIVGAMDSHRFMSASTCGASDPLPPECRRIRWRLDIEARVHRGRIHVALRSNRHRHPRCRLARAMRALQGRALCCDDCRRSDAPPEAARKADEGDRASPCAPCGRVGHRPTAASRLRAAATKPSESR